MHEKKRLVSFLMIRIPHFVVMGIAAAQAYAVAGLKATVVMMLAVESIWLLIERGKALPRIKHPCADGLLSLIISNERALGDLVEERQIRSESSPTKAQIWFSWQVAGSAIALSVQAIGRIAAFRRA